MQTRFPLLVSIALVLCSSPGLAELTIYGENSLHLQTYNNTGDSSASPYSHEGSQAYDRLNLQIENDISRYESMSLGLDSLWNESQYVGDDNGPLLERIHFSWEKGDAEIPLRLDAGDVYVGFSSLTANTSLKGAQLELQPDLKAIKGNSSIQVFAGFQQSDWMRFNANESLGSGASWLMDFGKQGALGLNVVYNQQQDSTGVIADRDQIISSLAWLKPINALNHRMKWEGELAWLKGDHNTNQGINDHGVLLDLKAKHEKMPLDWQLKFEEYGNDFQPAWGAVSSNIRRQQFRGGWRFPTQHRLRWRWEQTRTALESNDPTDTETVGFTLSGLLMDKISSSLNVYTSDASSISKSTNKTTDSVRLRLNRRLSDTLSLNGNLSWRATDDLTSSDSDSIARSAGIGVTINTDLGNWQTRFTPGLDINDSRGSAPVEEIAPKLGLAMTKGPHNLRLNWRDSNREGRSSNTNDLDQVNIDLGYNYRHKAHWFGLNINRFERSPEAADSTQAWKLGMVWGYNFDYQPSRKQNRTTNQQQILATTLTDLIDFGINTNQAQTIQQLNNSTFPFVRTGSRIAVEYGLFPELTFDQRIVLSYQADHLEAAQLSINFDNDIVSESAFRDVRTVLIKHYGLPSNVLEKGDFGTSGFELQRLSGDFIRHYEWQTPNGVLRFGIPYQATENARMVLEYRDNFPVLTEPRWGLNP